MVRLTTLSVNLAGGNGGTSDEGLKIASSVRHSSGGRPVWMDGTFQLRCSCPQRNWADSSGAEILMVSRPRVSDVVNKKTAKFTIVTLVEMLSRVGKPVKLAIG
jgi:hypothetical protein